MLSLEPMDQSEVDRYLDEQLDRLTTDSDTGAAALEQRRYALYGALEALERAGLISADRARDIAEAVQSLAIRPMTFHTGRPDSDPVVTIGPADKLGSVRVLCFAAYSDQLLVVWIQPTSAPYLYPVTISLLDRDERTLDGPTDAVPAGAVVIGRFRLGAWAMSVNVPRAYRIELTSETATLRTQLFRLPWEEEPPTF